MAYPRVPYRRAVPKRRRRNRAGRRIVRRTRARKRAQNNKTEVKWFKDLATISSDSQGEIRMVVNPTNCHNAGDFTTYASMYQEFKILKVTAYFLPSQVGSESLQTAAGVGIHRRGDSVTWVETGPAITPLSLTDVINRNSARMVQSRRAHKRWINRPSGYPEWGELSESGLIEVDDKWNTNIQMFGEGFTPNSVTGNQIFWYLKTSYKVMFRSRND